MSENFKNHTSNEIVERQVDIFYADMTHVISLTIQDLPDVYYNTDVSWETILKNAWKQHFSEEDNIFDFLRYCVYHTGLVGRFYKMNCALSLDGVISFLRGRLPDPDLAFKIWHKLHKVASLIMKESEENISLILDLHLNGNTVCDSSAENITFLNLNSLPIGNGRVLLYHITACCNINDKSILIGCSDASNLKSFTDVNDACTDFDDKSEVSEILKCTPSSNQYDSSVKSPTDSNDIDQWQKYGARPKNKQYSLKDYSNKENELNEFSNSSPKSYSDMGNLKESSSFVAGIRNVRRVKPMPSVSRGFKFVPPPPRETDLLFATPFLPMTSEGSRWWKRCAARLKNNRRYEKCCEISECETVNSLKNSDAESNESSDHKCILPSISSNVRSVEEMSSRSLNVKPDVLSERDKLRVLQQVYDSLLMSDTNSSTGYKLPASNAEDRRASVRQRSRYKPMSGGQENTSLELPFINLQSQNTQENVEANDIKNSSFGKNIHLHVRESILRHEIKTFFENYKFSDDMPSSTASNNNPIEETCSAVPSTDLPFNFAPFVDPTSSAEISDVTGQATAEANHDDQISGHLAIKEFDDKISFNWQNILKTKPVIVENFNSIALLDIPAGKSEEFSHNNKIAFLDGKPVSLGTADDLYGEFFKNIVQQLTDKTQFVQKMSPDNSESLQSSTHKTHSTPEKDSKLSYSEKPCDEIKPQESSEDDFVSDNEKFSDHFNESPKLSDFDNSADSKSASDFE